MFQMSAMESEARESAAAVRRQIASLARPVEEVAASIAGHPPRMLVTCARGSSDHAALFSKYLIEARLGWPVMSAAPSLVSVYEAEQQLAGSLMLSISQSGKSPDIVAYARMARAAGARTVAIVNTPESPLAEAAHWCLPLSARAERSIAATKSYICSLAAIMQLAAAFARSRELAEALDELPDLLDRAAAVDPAPLTRFLSSERNCFVVGRGLGFAIAQEAALKLKETCGIHAEAISAAEVQHGPMALLAQGVPIVFLIHGDRTTADQLALARRLSKAGARIFVAGPGSVAPDLTIAEGGSTTAAAIGIVQTFYLMAAELAARRGLDPDKPPLLSKVTETN